MRRDRSLNGFLFVCLIHLTFRETSHQSEASEARAESRGAGLDETFASLFHAQLADGFTDGPTWSRTVELKPSKGGGEHGEVVIQGGALSVETTANVLGKAPTNLDQCHVEVPMARVPYRLRADATGEDIAIFDRLETERKVPTPNIFLALAHAPAQLDGLLTYAKSLRGARELGKELRELAILSMSYARSGGYIAVHHEEDARSAGVTEEQLANMRAGADPDGAFNEVQSAVINLGRTVGNGQPVSQDLWDEAAQHLDHQQMIQLAMTIAWYVQGEVLTQMLDLDTEESYRK